MRDGLLAVNGVTAVHNLHIWALTMNQAVLTAHVAIGESAVAGGALGRWRPSQTRAKTWSQDPLRTRPFPVTSAHDGSAPCGHIRFLLSFSDETADAHSVLREMTQACFSSYNFHSVTIQMEKQSDLKPGCDLCEDPQV